MSYYIVCYICYIVLWKWLRLSLLIDKIIWNFPYRKNDLIISQNQIIHVINFCNKTKNVKTFNESYSKKQTKNKFVLESTKFKQSENRKQFPTNFALYVTRKYLLKTFILLKSGHNNDNSCNKRKWQWITTISTWWMVLVVHQCR